MDESGIVIVGAGEAGARAAVALRENRYAGPVTLIGDEVHRPYERPPLSKAVMTAETAPAAATIVDEARLAEHGIVHRAGTAVVEIDRAGRRIVLADRSSVAYDSLLLATGASARALPIDGATLPGVLALRTFDDALAMRERLAPGARIVVIGAGFIGLEIAASARSRDCDVTVLEMAPRVLMRGVPEAVASLVRARHERAGVVFRFGVMIDRIASAPDGLSVRLGGGDALACDLVVVGIGAAPRTSLANSAGLVIDNGVAVDGRLRTDDPRIYAAGDCCSFPHPLYAGRRLRLEAWRNAQDQGNHVARAMLGSPEPYAAVPWFWSDQYDQELQIAGLPDEASETLSRDLGAEAKLFFHLASDGRLVAASGLGPNRLIAKDMRLAEMMIARALRPDRAALASPQTKLKTLLAS